ncbi:MAG: alkylhydroperoxidase family enzyme [Bacteroidia bacterium]|jgi:alkylhydroperoxidase family enzyme
MAAFHYKDSPYPIREDLPSAYNHYWEALCAPGSWWTGAERVAIAQEVRNATQCGYCRERKQALSPYNFPGEHEHSGVLPEAAVDAVHRVITDQSRITQNWVDENTAQGFSEEQFVELLGITVTVFSIDEFNHALGLPLEPLPTPQPGEPDHYRPALAKPGTGYVAMLPLKGDFGEREANLWPPGRGANVLRALSLVPDAVRGWFGVAGAQYLALQSMMQFTGDLGRSINRMQMEIIAGRISSYNECFY